MAKLTDEKIALIQKLYDQYGIYSQVAKEVGCSPATVKKYVTSTTVSTPKKDYPKFTGEPLPLDQITRPDTHEGWLAWCSFTQEDLDSVNSLLEEM